jgi:predicted Ser/Thr protein kinase
MTPGTKLGPYEILAPIGAGGMGEVYRARDTKLDRDVAIKVLPTALAQHPERLARFEREAKVLAALNHPNIAGIYGLEDRAIVMELVEGPTLADRIAAGPIPLEESLKIAAQIADALEAAHEKGIVHRDLKPANVKVRDDGTVKVLDFGLATAVQSSGREPGDGANSPTLTMGATEVGVILGTASYMSPEQARGQKVDKRADIWAFGVVLYEMLTGQRLFDGPTVSDVLAQVLTKEPDWGRIPEKARRLVRKCLEKDPKRRLRDITGMELLLESGNEAPPNPAVTGGSGSGRLGWAVAAVLAVAGAGLGYLAWRHVTEETPRVAKLSVLPPEKGEIVGNNGPPAISPDGRRIVFGATVEGKNALWVRDLDSPTLRPLAGTEGAGSPFWSPDSRYIGFGAGGKLKKIDVMGGPVVTICDAAGLRGASWSKDDVIVFAPNNAGGLARVSAAGGAPAPVTELDKSRNENNHRYPWFLPDGRHFLYLGRSNDTEKSAFFVGDLESKEGKLLVAATLPNNAAYAVPVGGTQGHLLFLRDRSTRPN